MYIKLKISAFVWLCQNKHKFLDRVWDFNQYLYNFGCLDGLYDVI